MPDARELLMKDLLAMITITMHYVISSFNADEKVEKRMLWMILLASGTHHCFVAKNPCWMSNRIRLALCPALISEGLNFLQLCFFLLLSTGIAPLSFNAMFQLQGLVSNDLPKFRPEVGIDGNVNSWCKLQDHNLHKVLLA